MWYDRNMEDYSCSADYCDKKSYSSTCRYSAAVNITYRTFSSMGTIRLQLKVPPFSPSHSITNSSSTLISQHQQYIELHQQQYMGIYCIRSSDAAIAGTVQL